MAKDYRKIPVEILSERTLFAGKRLEVKETTTLHKNGKKRVKQTVEARRPIAEFEVNGAVMLPILYSESKGTFHLILEKHFRIAQRGYVLEAPGGTCEKPNEELKDLAVRELWEETGYKGEVIDSTSQRVSYGEGFINAATQIVTMLVDADHSDHVDPLQNIPTNELEMIDVYLLPLTSIEETREELNRMVEEEHLILSSHLYLFILGMDFQAMKDNVVQWFQKKLKGAKD